MRRVLLAALGTVGCWAVLAGAQRPQFRADTDLVTLHATVVDREGRLVTDLTANDFEVYDNGRLQPLSLFASDTQPIALVMMLDRSGSVTPHNERVQKAAEELVANLLPGDRARIGSFSRRVEMFPDQFTSDRNELVRILRHNLQRGGPTPLWEAADAAMDALEGIEGRRVLVVFSDGRNSPTFSQAEIEFDDIRGRARQDDVMVYAIGLATECDVTSSAAAMSFDGALFQRRPPGRGGRIGGWPIPRLPGIPIGPGGIRLPPPGTLPPPAMPMPRGEGMDAPPPCRPTEPDPDLRHLASDGGGGYFELDRADDLGATFSRVADELHRQYLLAFQTPERDGLVHELVVRVRRADVSVRARTSYLAR